MVELCELKLLLEADAWPADIDTQIANLDFGGDSVLFESFDPSVSTDSLDSEQLREQCRPRTDDYQMTFADSGHWQSGIRSPPTQGLTTWGRIRSTEPLDDRTASAPDIAGIRGSTASQPRPASLLANFVDGRRSIETRYVDLNDNEITTTANTRQTISQQATATSPNINTAPSSDRWRFRAATAPVKPRRTFADLQKKMAPELQFLALPHRVPILCDDTSSLSLSDVIVNVKREGLPRLTSDLDAVIPNLLQDDTPDSGLGCSGPSHIEDWGSLSVLLPKHVADACSFFKNNSQLLGSEHSNCIERSRRSEPCRTCFRVRRRLHPPSWAHSATSRHVLCDCQTTSDFQEDGHDFSAQTSRPATVAGSIPRPSLRARELSVVGLPIYAVKRQLVEAVVEGVAAVARGDGPAVLIEALEALVADGLNEDCSVWHMIRTVTAPGPATKDVYSIVKQLDSSEKSDNSRVKMFFEQLLRESSLDCWMCYVVLKENVLKRLYGCGSFLLTSPTAYRSLLWRLIDSLALIPVLEARECCSSSMHTRSMWSGVPSRIASDSRVPKSSSVPARLSANLAIRPSRIPLPMRRCELSRTQSRSPSRSFLASVRSDDHDTVPQGHLPVWQGERVRVLSRRGNVARCCRTQPRRGCIISGVIPLNNLLIQ